MKTDQLGTRQQMKGMGVIIYFEAIVPRTKSGG